MFVLAVLIALQQPPKISESDAQTIRVVRLATTLISFQEGEIVFRQDELDNVGDVTYSFGPYNPNWDYPRETWISPKQATVVRDNKFLGPRVQSGPTKRKLNDSDADAAKAIVAALTYQAQNPSLNYVPFFALAAYRDKTRWIVGYRPFPGGTGRYCSYFHDENFHLIE